MRRFCATCKQWYSTAEPHSCVGGLDEGHRFTLTAVSRGSFRMQDGPHFDADWSSEPWTLTVRAWSLRAALRKAAELPLSAWDRGEDDDAVVR